MRSNKEVINCLNIFLRNAFWFSPLSTNWLKSAIQNISTVYRSWFVNRWNFQIFLCIWDVIGGPFKASTYISDSKPINKEGWMDWDPHFCPLFVHAFVAGKCTANAFITPVVRRYISYVPLIRNNSSEIKGIWVGFTAMHIAECDVGPDCRRRWLGWYVQVHWAGRWFPPSGVQALQRTQWAPESGSNFTVGQY